jgi:hypothetical protein
MDSDQFDYGAEIDDEAVQRVSNEMADGGLKPLTDGELAAAAEWRRQLQESYEHDRLVHERAQVEAERLRRDAARREQEIAHREYVSRQREQFKQNNELADLKRYAQKTESYRNSVERTAHNNLRVQYQNSLFQELDQMIAARFAPPAPEPED